MSRLPRSEYPKCPRCGGPVAGAMMTSQSVDLAFGTAKGVIYYHPEALSVYCVSAECNWDHKLGDLTTPVPGEAQSQAMTTQADRERARTFWHEWIDETASEKVERVRLDALAAEFAAVREEAERRVSNRTGEPETCPECGAQYWTPGNLDIALHADKAWRKAFVEAKQREAWDAARSQTYGATFKPESRYATFEAWVKERGNG